MNLFETDEKAEIARNAAFILETPKYSCPLNRDFGLNALFLDAPANKAMAAMRAEIAEQVEKLEPRVKVAAISFGTDPADGIIRPRLTLEFLI